MIFHLQRADSREALVFEQLFYDQHWTFGVA
jgi:hypothetical protein